MHRKFLSTYLIIVIVLVGSMSLSKQKTEAVRGAAVSVLAPAAEKGLSIRTSFFNFFQIKSQDFSNLKNENAQLQIENQLLYAQLEVLKKNTSEQVDFDDRLSNSQVIAAKVIFRTMDTWNHSIWIDAGKKKNNMNSAIIAINSPVVIGKGVVGVIDYVGEYQSRVRLISDPSLSISVRSSRGSEQDYLFIQRLNYVISELQSDQLLKQLPRGLQDQSVQLLDSFETLKQHFSLFNSSSYLAKGELAGAINPARHGQQLRLKGIGFNWDFFDEIEDKRDRIKKNYKPIKQAESEKLLLQVGDVLVTTGLDGIFPKGFQVAIIDKIELLKEGDFYYNLEAKPIIDHLEEIEHVFVLPPLVPSNALAEILQLGG